MAKVTVIQHRSGHRQRAELDGTYIYIGRPSKWGNPFLIRKNGRPVATREEVIQQFTDYWYADAQAQLRAEALVEIPPGSVLGCFCAPRPCHGDVIAEFLNRTRATQ